MRSLIAYASMAIKNWKVTGSIGGPQVLTFARSFSSLYFSRNHARIQRDEFLDTTGFEIT
ncbi:MAG TPA: hypothetical protein VIK01_08365 [Polyangiaceae bacterium]